MVCMGLCFALGLLCFYRKYRNERLCFCPGCCSETEDEEEGNTAIGITEVNSLLITYLISVGPSTDTQQFIREFGRQHSTITCATIWNNTLCIGSNPIKQFDEKRNLLKIFVGHDGY